MEPALHGLGQVVQNRLLCPTNPATCRRTSRGWWSKKPELHELTEAAQGKYPLHDRPLFRPRSDREPGDRIRIETRDAFEGAIRTERDKPTKRLRMPFVNPQNGPIMIDGAEPGDALAVHIESMLPRGENPAAPAA